MAYLFTNHDPNHIHAILGFTALIHWFYRLYLIALDVPDAGFGQNATKDILSMIVMIAPNASSFVFSHVSAKKGTDGFTIWKEYRWHAFVFAFKMWLLQALILYTKYNDPQSDGKLKYDFFCKIALEFGVMMVASYITSLYPKQESTIRGMYKERWSVFLIGGMQFVGRAAIMYGQLPDSKDEIALCILAIMTLQVNAFNMTLRKKRITGLRTTQAIYSAIVFGSFYLMAIRRFSVVPPTGFMDPRFKPFYLAGLAYYLRRSGCDKFSSWIIALCVLGFVTQQFGLFGEEQKNLIPNVIPNLTQNLTALPRTMLDL